LLPSFNASLVGGEATLPPLIMSIREHPFLPSPIYADVQIKALLQGYDLLNFCLPGSLIDQVRAYQILHCVAH